MSENTDQLIKIQYRTCHDNKRIFPTMKIKETFGSQPVLTSLLPYNTCRVITLTHSVPEP